MENSKFDKRLVFDKILVNTYPRCIERINLEEANKILMSNVLTYYNSTYDYAVKIIVEEYDFKTEPTFTENEMKILRNFYEVTFIFKFDV
jgi:hypothetical protein